MSQADISNDQEAEARHREAEARVQSFSYRKPDNFDGVNKGLVRMCQSDILKGIVQVIKEGGENDLHFHDGMDSFWMVLKGRAAFYGPGDVLIGEYGPMEGLLMPRGARYWFAKASDDEDLELLQVAAYEGGTRAARRIDLSGEKPKSNRNRWFDAQNGNAVFDHTRE